MEVIGDENSLLYEEDGRDEASGYSYLVSITATEVVDPATVPRDRLRMRFKYNVLPGDRPTSRFTFALHGEISRALRSHLGYVLGHYSLPSAAHNHTMELLFRLYGCPCPTDREDIQALIVVNAYGYAPPSGDLYDDFEERIFVPISSEDDHVYDDVYYDDDDDDNELDRAMEESALECLRPNPASRDAIEALEKVTVKEKDVEENSCAVCLDGFVIGSEATRMPCSHVFHGDCIVRWLENGYFCPLCRFELPIAG